MAATVMIVLWYRTINRGPLCRRIDTALLSNSSDGRVGGTVNASKGLLIDLLITVLCRTLLERVKPKLVWLEKEGRIITDGFV